MPLISVLMSNFNTDEEYLREAIESILDQTFTDFEFIIVDDASTDDSLSVIESYSRSDKRISILKNDTNLGLAASLNRGLEKATGKYIARTDSDDIYFPERLEKQIEWMQAHPDYIVCGTWFEKIGDGSGFYNKKIPDHETYRIRLLFDNNPAIPHTSAMFNNELLKKYKITYDDKYRYAQDYRMWTKCSQVAKIGIIESILLYVRINPKGISVAKSKEQDIFTRMNIEDQLSLLGLSLDDQTYSIHKAMLSRYDSASDEIKNWMRTLIAANEQKNIYDKRLFKAVLQKNWKARLSAERKKDKSIHSLIHSIKEAKL